jgi:hypothetical protein
MRKPNDPLTSLSQLNELNRDVWLRTERFRKVSQGLGKQEFVDPLPPCENSVSAKMATTDAADIPALPDDRSDAAMPKEATERQQQCL